MLPIMLTPPLDDEVDLLPVLVGEFDWFWVDYFYEGLEEVVEVLTTAEFFWVAVLKFAIKRSLAFLLGSLMISTSIIFTELVE